MNRIVSILFSFLTIGVFAQGPFAPAAGFTGTTAIFKDSSIFVDWATACAVKRGLQNIAKPSSDTTSVGTPTNATGKADGNLVVSLGDGGEAILTFNGLIHDGPGPDFAIFENAFNSTFLELAFVEVSSDGLNYFRFPATSLTDTSTAIGSFDTVKANNINNLAGKYQARYGTPFDLNELQGTPGLNIQSITHIKVIDVIGAMNTNFAQRDNEGRKINDPYPTEFPSGGFDLDAVGVIHMKAVGLKELTSKEIKVYPNPFVDRITIASNTTEKVQYRIFDVKGTEIKSGLVQNSLRLEGLQKGIYFLELEIEGEIIREKLIRQ